LGQLIEKINHGREKTLSKSDQSFWPKYIVIPYHQLDGNKVNFKMFALLVLTCRRWRARALDDSKVEEQELHGHTLPQPEEDFSFGKCDLGRGGVLMNTTPIRK